MKTSRMFAVTLNGKPCFFSRSIRKAYDEIESRGNITNIIENEDETRIEIDGNKTYVVAKFYAELDWCFNNLKSPAQGGKVCNRVMNIFELVFNNGESYEDRIVECKYYETLHEAKVAFDAFVYDYLYCPRTATLTINELELGTQKRTEVFTRQVCKLPSQRRYERIENERRQAEEERLQEEYETRMSASNGCSVIADIEALEALRAKLAAF